MVAEYNACIPKYRADFLLTYAKGGKEETLILEYDGLEYHFQNPRDVNNLNFSQSYLDYNTQRQMELEGDILTIAGARDVPVFQFARINQDV